MQWWYDFAVWRRQEQDQMTGLRARQKCNDAIAKTANF
jgi:hypothetical protein